MSLHLLVTGGAGFIGSNFIRFVLREREHYSVTNLDSLTYSGNLDNLAEFAHDPRYRFIHGNVRDHEIVSQLVDECDAIVHFAAESHVDRSIEDSRSFVETNTLGTQVLLEALRQHDSRRMVHVSTDEVYGALPLDRQDLRFSESSVIAPNSPYAASKAAADMLVRAYHKTFGLDVITTRCSNNFGPFQFPEKVIPLFVTNLIQGKQVPLYGDGRNVRDWIHVEDHCEAILNVLERGYSGEIYNVGGNNEQSNLDLTRQILNILGLKEDRIRHVPDRLGHDRRYAVSSAKLEKELGWKPRRSVWPEALEQTVQWYVENEKWWRRIESNAYRQTAPPTPLIMRPSACNHSPQGRNSEVFGQQQTQFNDVDRPTGATWFLVQRVSALTLLVILAPGFVFLWLAVKLTSRGPFLYSQLRPGLGEKPFKIWKIRTMRPGADRNQALARCAKSSNPEVTAIGRILRQLKLDELPQLWNIVRGDMALVGPRPIAFSLYDELCGEIPQFKTRTVVRPGLTNVGQVCIEENAGPSGVVDDWKVRFEAEQHYMANRSAMYDLVVISLTSLYVGRKIARLMWHHCAKMCDFVPRPVRRYLLGVDSV